jgi:hypothetical protein
MGSEDREGNQDSSIAVFTKDNDGNVRHFYTAHPWMANDVKERGMDLLTPVYNLLDIIIERPWQLVCLAGLRAEA